MNFTPNKYVRPAISGILTIAVVGLIGWGNHVGRTPAPINATHETVAAQALPQAPDSIAIVPAVQLADPMAKSAYYQPVSSWYKSKHWWKRNAPIIGGAGGGALIGGLAGGGTGALIGGAVGAGGGYAYKRYRHHHHHDNRYYHH